MSTSTVTPVVLDRYEKPGNLASIAALAANGQIAIRQNELIRTTDNRVYLWTGTALEVTSAPVHHGTVATADDLAGIYLLPSCTRGVHSGDTAYVTAAGCEYRVTSGVNAAATWASCAAIPTSASAIGADPAGAASAAVSAHNTATDSHSDLRTLIAGKQPSLTISPVGNALLNVATPSTPKLLLVEVDGSVSMLDVPSGGGADTGPWADPCVQWWFDTGTGVQGLAGAPTTTGAAVHAWSDRSAHRWSAAQAGDPPSWVAGALNGHGAVRSASGSQQRLRARVCPYQAGLVGDFTALVLARRSTPTGLACLFGQSSSPRVSMYSYTDGRGEDLRVVVGSSSYVSATSYTPSTSWELIEVRYRAGNASFFVNGSALQTVSATLTHAVTYSEWDLFLGAYTSQGCDVYLAACVLLDGRATELFCDTVRAWLLDFSGL